MIYIPTIKLESPTEQRLQLNFLGFAVDESVPGYSLRDVLIRFQRANGLEADGVYGPLTQAALFNAAMPNGSLVAVALRVASAMVGIREVPEGSNKGPQIDLLLKSVGLNPGYAWCAAFAYWCFREASRQLVVKNPCPKNAGVLNMWDLAGYKESGLTRITAAQAKANPALVKPGMLGLLDLGKRQGHIFFVENVAPTGRLGTIEGNTNEGLSREGVGVFRLNRRTIQSVNLGFIGLV